jgi:hypothetical protein
LTAGRPAAVASPVAVTLLSTEYQGEWTLH